MTRSIFTKKQPRIKSPSKSGSTCEGITTEKTAGLTLSVCSTGRVTFLPSLVVHFWCPRRLRCVRCRCRRWRRSVCLCSLWTPSILTPAEIHPEVGLYPGHRSDHQWEQAVEEKRKGFRWKGEVKKKVRNESEKYVSVGKDRVSAGMIDMRGEEVMKMKEKAWVKDEKMTAITADTWIYMTGIQTDPWKG